MQKLRSSGVLALAAFGVACSSLLGIEDVYEGPDPASAGADGGTASGASGASSGGKGGSGTSGQGGTPNGGKGGSAQAGSSSGGAAGSGGSATAGSGATGGTGNAGAGGGNSGSGGSTEGGEGGMGGEGPVSGTVRGRVVSYFLQPIEDVHVMIGDASADTDEDGQFEIPDVGETYDAKLVVNYRRNNTTSSYGWVYEGLTRRDPTLQVYGGLDDKSGAVFVVPEDAVIDATRQAVIAIGSDYGDSQHEPSSAAGLHTSSNWNGPDTVPAVAHGLLWNIDENELPTTYLSYATTPATLTTTAEANVYVSLPDGELDSGAISGSITSPTTDDRANKAFLRFSTNASIELFWDYGSNLDPTSFTYNVPAVANGWVTIAALEGTSFFGAAAVAHRGGLAPGQSNIVLEIPEPAELMAPPNEDAVDEETIFSWTSDAETFVWHAEDEDSPNFAGLYIVTTRKQITLPSFPNGFGLAANNLHSWRVETHGTGSTVDDLAGPQGFADAFGETKGEAPTGPRRDDAGTFAISVARTFTIPE